MQPDKQQQVDPFSAASAALMQQTVTIALGSFWCNVKSCLLADSVGWEPAAEVLILLPYAYVWSRLDVSRHFQMAAGIALVAAVTAVVQWRQQSTVWQGDWGGKAFRY